MSVDFLLSHPPRDRRHQFVVVDSIKGNRDTLPIISTFSLFLGQRIDTVDCIWF